MKNWPQCKKILCIRLDNIGDLIMTTPAIRALRETDKSRRITLLTSQAASEAVSLIPGLNDSITYNAPWMKATTLRRTTTEDFQIIKRLRERHFDAAIIFTVFSQNPLPAAMLCYLAEIPLRLAYCHENPYQLLTHWIKDPDPQTGIRHEVQRQLELVASMGSFTENSKLALSIPDSTRENLVTKLEAKALHVCDRLIVIHPGATAPSRRYPAAKFTQAASSLVERGFQVVFTGQEEERDLIEDIQRNLSAPSESFIGELDLAELVALISLARILVTNNTAPAHIAAAVGTPVVDLYALTNPQHTPWLVPHRLLSHDVPCKFCFKSVCPEMHNNCLQLVPWQDVVKAVEDLMKETASCIH